MLYKTFLLLCVGVAWRGVGVDSNQLKIAQPRPKRLYFNLKVQKDISHQRESPFLCNGQTIKSRLSFEAKIESFYWRFILADSLPFRLNHFLKWHMLEYRSFVKIVFARKYPTMIIPHKTPAYASPLWDELFRQAFSYSKGSCQKRFSSINPCFITFCRVKTQTKAKDELRLLKNQVGSFCLSLGT